MAHTNIYYQITGITVLEVIPHAKFVKNSSPLFNSSLLLILLPCKGLAFGLDPERTHLKGTGRFKSLRQTDRLRQGMLSMWVQWEWHMCDNIIGVINASLSQDCYITNL